MQHFESKLGKIRLQKRLFLFVQKQEIKAYDFVLYCFGCYSYSANTALEKYNNLSAIDKVGEIGISLTNEISYCQKLMHNEEAIIADFENIVSEDMRRGTRHLE